MHTSQAFNPAEGYVYIMECGGYYKIGWAQSNPRKRRSLLQIGSPFPLTLVGVIEGSRMVESDWHDTFAGKRVRGEWFALTTDDVACILNDCIGLDVLPGDDDIA